MNRRERPLCRAAIAKLGLWLDETGIPRRPDGSRAFVSAGIKAQLRKQAGEKKPVPAVPEDLEGGA